MIATIAALVLASQAAAAPAQAGWTWTLYENSGPLVLANEVPDTPRLKATLECERGSSIVDVALYDVTAPAGIATVSSGEATANAETENGRGRLKTSLRVDQPVFSAFQASGDLRISIGDQALSVRIDRAHLSKLRRFSELCVG